MLAATGLLLVLFLAAHLGGVGLALVDPRIFEAWSLSLHTWWPLPLLEAALVVLFLLHPLKAAAKALANAAAAPRVQAGRRSRRGSGLEALAALAARTSPWSGALLLLFLVVHLAQLRWVRPPAGGELAAVMGVLAQPQGWVLYSAAGLALALHLFQGVEGAHRSLGLLDGANAGLLRWFGRLVAVLLGGGFCLLSLALAWGAQP
ncbi:MAG: succinate dehydrogenase [Cyanobacteria bacterium]|nr:succinate dehydrogenase [Cyanobacteriota bacterium]